MHIQRQQQNVSPQHNQQMQPPSIIHQQGEEGDGHALQQQDETINSGMTVREYLTGAGKKKLRMEQSQ